MPIFDEFPVADIYSGPPASPILATPEQRMFRTRIRNGVATGAGVGTGSWKEPVASRAPNFAGHYFVIRWGCGSQCLTMAIVDAKTGAVYPPPLSFDGRSLQVPLDHLSNMEVDFRPNSRLMMLKNGCRDYANRKTCGEYYFEWQNGRFVQRRFVFVDTEALVR